MTTFDFQSNKHYKEFELEYGKITAIVGDNGSGKTTMIYSLLGLSSTNKYQLSGMYNNKWKTLAHFYKFSTKMRLEILNFSN